MAASGLASVLTAGAANDARAVPVGEASNAMGMDRPTRLPDDDEVMWSIAARISVG